LLLLGGMSLALASAASAQSAGPPPTPAPPETIVSPSPANAPAVPAPPAAASAPAAQPGLPPQRIAAMVRAHGFHPVGPPVRHGNVYVQRALDPDDMEYRLVIDPLTGRTLSVRPMGMTGPFAYGPGPHAPPPYRPARYWGPPPPADFGFGYGTPRPPRRVPTARLAPPETQPAQQPPPQQHVQPQPNASAQAPLPRPKPYVMEATGSIPVDSPATPAPPKTPEPEQTPEPPKAAPQDNGAAAMPPVAPLD
jgi:hypothetical protein